MLRSSSAVVVVLCARSLISCGDDSGGAIRAADAGVSSSGGGSSGGASSGGAAGASGVGGVIASGGSSADASTGLDLDAADAACRTGALPSVCIECCGKNHPGAYPVQQDATRACACVSPGICGTICGASYCKGQPDDQACYDCVFSTLGPSDECYQVALNACGADAQCTAYVECRANCVL